MIRILTVICFITVFHSSSAQLASVKALNVSLNRTIPSETYNATCSCAIFLSSQLVKGKNRKPVGYPPVAVDFDETVPCTPKYCIKKCIEKLVKYLEKSSAIICPSIDRDCFRERGYLFLRECNGEWLRTNISAGEEYCCKNDEPRKCSDDKA